MRTWAAAATTLLAAGSPALAYVYTQPPLNSRPSLHAPLRTEDCSALRHVHSDAAITAHENPGVRVFSEFLTAKDTQRLLTELQPIKQQYGINLISAREAALYKWQQSLLPGPQPPVNMMRITGRPEAAEQRLPPWRYGDDFNESGLPPQLRALVERVRSLPGLKLGELRDVTINYRHSGFLRLDPHIDPALDGENVFIIGLDSDTVLTLCPAARRQLWQWLCSAWDALLLRDERERVAQEARESWTPWDIDVYAKAGSLVHLSGDARWTWTHGTRVGLPPPPESTTVNGDHSSSKSSSSSSASPFSFHDFWAVPSSVVLRGKERHSIVLAFAEGSE